MNLATKQPKRIIDNFKPIQVDIRSPAERPFFRLRLSRQEARKLADRLEQLGQSGGPEWCSLTANKSVTANPQVLKLWRNYAAKYEIDASPPPSTYLRGSLFRVRGAGQSCHIDFSATGAAMIAIHLKKALARAREFVELVVPNRWRKLDLIEFIADADLEAAAEIDSLGQSGGLLLDGILPRDDFSDWEQPA